MTVIITLSYLFIGISSYYIGKDRKIGGLMALAANVLFPGLGVILALFSKKNSDIGQKEDMRNNFNQRAKDVNKLKESLEQQINRREDLIEQKKSVNLRTRPDERKQKADIKKLIDLRNEESSLYRAKHEANNTVVRDDYIAIRKSTHSDGHISFELPYDLPESDRKQIERTIHRITKERGFPSSLCEIRTSSFQSTDFSGISLQRGDIASTVTVVYDVLSDKLRTISEHCDINIESIVPHIDEVDSINREVNLKVSGADSPQPFISHDSFGITYLNGDTLLLHYEGKPIAWAIPGDDGRFAFKGLGKEFECNPFTLMTIEHARNIIGKSKNINEWISNAKSICLSEKNLDNLRRNVLRPVKELNLEPAKRIRRSI